MGLEILSWLAVGYFGIPLAFAIIVFVAFFIVFVAKIVRLMWANWKYRRNIKRMRREGKDFLLKWHEANDDK